MNPIDYTDIKLKDIFNVYAVSHEGMAKPFHKLLGRVAITPVEIHVITDYYGTLSDLEGPNDNIHKRRWKSWQNGSHSLAVSLDDLKQGHHPELLQEANLPKIEMGPKESWYQVHRTDLQEPLLVRFLDGQASMNDQPLSDEELNGLLSSDGVKIKHHRPMVKSDTLEKKDPGLEEALAAIKTAGVDPKHMEAIHNALFMDPMVPSIKNARSFHSESASTPGVHVAIDANDFKDINTNYGYKGGDSAIKTIGNAMRQSADAVMGEGHPHVWRRGGDEFSASFPTHEHAAHFLRTLHSKIAELPAIGGTHKLSISGGIGPSPEIAEQALNEHAKPAKTAEMKANKWIKGQAQSHFHSLMPGHEGAIQKSEPALKNPGPEVPTK